MLIELAKDGLGDETLLIAKDGVVTDGSNTERAKSIELGRAGSKGGDIRGNIQGVGVEGFLEFGG
jgi:hypothetical protein